MVYLGTDKTETIWFEPANNTGEVHCIELYKPADEPVFYVTTCDNDDWMWAFKADVASNYEIIKYTIMDAIISCCCVSKLLDVLDAIFAEEFADILADEDDGECNCDGNVNCCENCNHRDCLN